MRQRVSTLVLRDRSSPRRHSDVAQIVQSKNTCFVSEALLADAYSGMGEMRDETSSRPAAVAAAPYNRPTLCSTSPPKAGTKKA